MGSWKLSLKSKCIQIFKWCILGILMDYNMQSRINTYVLLVEYKKKCPDQKMAYERSTNQWMDWYSLECIHDGEDSYKNWFHIIYLPIIRLYPSNLNFFFPFPQEQTNIRPMDQEQPAKWSNPVQWMTLQSIISFYNKKTFFFLHHDYNSLKSK